MGAGLGVLRTVGAPTPSADRGGSRVTLCLGVLAVLWDCGGLQPLEEPQWANLGRERARVHTGFRVTMQVGVAGTGTSVP